MTRADLFIASLTILLPITFSQNISFTDLASCSESSLVLSTYGPDDILEPCILYDIQDYVSSTTTDAKSLLFDISVDAANDVNNNTSEVTLVQATPSNCHNHRDGAVTSVKLLNADNDGKGMAIGHMNDHYVKFRLISIVGGNPNNIGVSSYGTFCVVCFTCKNLHSIFLLDMYRMMHTASCILQFLILSLNQ